MDEVGRRQASVSVNGAWNCLWGSDTEEIWSAFFNAVEVWVYALYLMEGHEKQLCALRDTLNLLHKFVSQFET